MTSQTTYREFTIKAPEFAYAQLELHADETAAPVTLDELFVRSYCTDALRQYLGLTGAAIPLDILKVEGRQCWLRMPRDDLKPFAAALMVFRGTVGDEGDAPCLLRVKQCSDWLGTMVGGDALEKLWHD
ncbi:hypothetical protein LLEC1_02804 [Akanthomyces lecanii]|uniref:Ribonucleases P/MRP subunit Pop8-like domain-containing protein n=1 Tax=Cordyceps confragosa TaxID=2714763 RepID=A0A179I1X3_CORDF|nr:hypothetical protein LLEC1_02804 [Akanthomyces lecanii]